MAEKIQTEAPSPPPRAHDAAAALLQQVLTSSLIAVSAGPLIVALTTGLGTGIPIAAAMFTRGLQVAGLASAALCMVLTWRTRGRDSRALATFLGLLTFVLVMVVVPPSPAPEWYRTIRNSAWCVTAIQIVLLSVPGFMAAALGRFTCTFPRDLTIEDILHSDALTNARGTLGALGRFAHSLTRKTRRLRASRLMARATGRVRSNSRENMMQALALFQSNRVWALGFVPMLVGTAVMLFPPSLWPIAASSVLLGVYAAAVIFVGTTYPVTFLLASYAVADPQGRRRMLWIVEGFVTAFWICFGAAFLNFLSDTLHFGLPGGRLTMVGAAPLALLSFLTCTAIAVFHDGALDPRLAIRRTSVYGALGLVAVFVFAGIENLVTNGLAARLGFSPAVGGWIAGGIVALGMAKMRSFVVRRFMAPADAASPKPLPPGHF